MTAPAMKLAIEWTRVTAAAIVDGLLDIADAMILKKETAHTLKVGASTTADTAGGALSVLAGDGGATNANGGDLSLDAGAKAGSGTSGTAKLGRTNANAVEIGRTGKATTVKGTLTVDESATLTTGGGFGGAQDSKSILSCTSTTKGFLPPVMTTTQRNAISSPTEGLVVYNSTTHKLNVYTGSAWEAVTSA